MPFLGIFFFNRYAKANSENMKDYGKNMESSCLKYEDVNNLYRWQGRS